VTIEKVKGHPDEVYGQIISD